MGYIYKITNKINNKIYIGQTVYTITHRWKDHLDESGNNIAKHYLLHQAINKYGVDNFIVEELERCDNEKLNERERYWIKIFNSYYLTGYGYNMTYGGEGTLRYSDEEILELWNKGLKSGEIAKKLNANPNTVSDRLKILLPPGSARQRHADSNKRGILQYDLNGNLIKYWDCAQSAEKELNLSGGSITKCCKKDRLSAYDCLWKYIEDDTPIEELMIAFAKSVKCNKVDMFDKNGKYIKTYESGKQAELENKIARGSVSGVCNHKWKSAGGYKWEWNYPLKRQLIELGE